MGCRNMQPDLVCLLLFCVVIRVIGSVMMYGRSLRNEIISDLQVVGWWGQRRPKWILLYELSPLSSRHLITPPEHRQALLPLLNLP